MTEKRKLSETTADTEMISVIIPVYQAAPTIHACVNSLLEQENAGEYEIVLVDDGSTDGSGEICDRIKEKEPRVKVFHTENRGAAAARNTGIDRAAGSLISFVDSDDTVEPDYLNYLRRLRQAAGTRLVVAAHDAPEAGSEKRSEKDRGSMMDYYPGKNALKALLYQEHFMSVPWGMLSEKELWDKVRFPENTEAEDMGTIYRLFMAAGDVAYGDRVVYHYLQRPASTIRTTGSTRNPAYYRHSREMVKQIRRECPEVLGAACHRHFSACCQILSESHLTDRAAFLKRVRSDLAILSPGILKDRDARSRNRAAALVAMISPLLLHVMLRLYERIRSARYAGGIGG